MRKFECDDYETPIELYPGYIGCTWDGQFTAGTELQALTDFDWRNFNDLLDEIGSLKVRVPLRGEALFIDVEAYDDIAFILDQMPTIDVWQDNGPPDAGPASGAGYVFTISDSTTLDELHESVAALRRALGEALTNLRNAADS